MKRVLLAALLTSSGAEAAEPTLTPLVGFKISAGAADQSDDDGAVEADLDLGFDWRPADNLQLVGNFEMRDRISDEGFSDLNNDLSALTGVADGVAGGPIQRLEKLWLRLSFSDASQLTLGRLHFEDHLGDNALSSKSATAFANDAFSGKPAIAFPRDAFGVVFQTELTEGWRAVFVIGDADRQSELDVFANEAVFVAAELQHERRQFGSPAHYRLALWGRSDADHALGEMGGFALSFDQGLGNGATFMLRYHEASDGVRAAQRGAGVALGVNGALWGREHDQAGTGLVWLEPNDPTRGTQTVSEVFYRWQFHRDIALTPSLQLITEDDSAGTERGGVYAGLRLRYRPTLRPVQFTQHRSLTSQ